jgi:hypothetical protein
MARSREREVIIHVLDQQVESANDSRLAEARIGWSWIALTVFAVAVFALAFYGARGSAWGRLEDALHLFPSGFPSQPAPGEHPTTAYQIAELLAPFVALFLSLKLVTTVFARNLNALRARLRRRHAVVVGLGATGLAAVRAFHARGIAVTGIDRSPSATAVGAMSAAGALTIHGDGREAETLDGAAARRAAYVVAATGDDAANAAIAAAATRLPAGGGPRSVFAHIADPELSYLLRSAALAATGARVHVFNAYDLWGRCLVDAVPELRGPAPPCVVVFGDGELAETAIVEAARRWHLGEAPGRQQIVQVDSEATVRLAGLRRRYPAIGHRSELSATDDPGAIPPHPTAVFVCSADGADNLATALRARHLLGDAAAPIVLPASAWTAAPTLALFRGTDGVRIVDLAGPEQPLDLLRDSVHESLARAVHAAYLADRADDPDFGDRPADRPWTALDDDQREANRRHVDAIVAQIEAVWLEVAPEFDWDATPLPLSHSQVETMARIEHDRWMAERVAQGWTHGAVRDNTARRHPSIVAWDELPEDTREANRTTIRQRPAVLARAGLRVVVRPIRARLARALHGAYLAARADAGDSAPTQVPWDELDPEARALALDAADDIAGKLAAAHLQVVPAGHGGAALPDDVIERLAEAEHERWCAVRRSQGWRYGPERDDVARTHPDLVPWSDLPEARRQIDRDQVAAIPAALAECGLAISAGSPAAPAR